MLYRGDDARRLARLAALAGAARRAAHRDRRRALSRARAAPAAGRPHLHPRASDPRRRRAPARRQCRAPPEVAGGNGAPVSRRAGGGRRDAAPSRTLPLLARRAALRISRRDPRGLATPQEALVASTEDGARRRYPDGIPAKVRAALDHEFALIAELNYAPYFLTVHDIVRFARVAGHPVPGPRLGGQFGGLLLPRHHRGRSRAASISCSSASSPPSAASRPTSTSISSTSGARRSSSTSTSATAAIAPASPPP